MKFFSRLAAGWCRFLAVLASGLVLAGCATTPKINWAARVGNYTMDQAIAELGPPDKQARLQDNSIVAEWLLRRGYNTTYVSGGYGWWYPRHHFYGGFYPGYYDSYYPDYFIRLTFGPDGRLTAWKKFYR